MKNEHVDLRNYRLFIEMAGDNFDGLLNFGAVILLNNGKQYLLDITDTEGNIKQAATEQAIGTYHLYSKFEDDLAETEEMFRDDPDYDFDQDLAALLADKNTLAFINLEYHGGLSDELKDSRINMGRIRKMGLIDMRDENYFLKVQMSDKY